MDETGIGKRKDKREGGRERRKTQIEKEKGRKGEKEEEEGKDERRE